jgi:hypothetical protein
MQLSKKKYYISNILKKPQRVNVRQFVHHVEQLNAYIAQMPCFYYSPNANASTKPENVPVTKAQLGAHVLCMCPLQWQDRYNMNKKSMTLMDMRSLLTSLDAIKHVCTYEKGKSESPEKSSHKSKKGKKLPGTKATVRVPKKVCTSRSIATCARSMGLCIPHTTLVTVVGLRRTERRNLISAPLRKAVRKVIL